MKWMLAIILIGCTSGCIIIPTPHWYVDGSRENVSQENFRIITPGVDTMEDVVLRLGEPDSFSDDGCEMGYTSKKVLSQQLVFMVDSGTQLSKWRYYNLTFETNGVVTSVSDYSKKTEDH